MKKVTFTVLLFILLVFACFPLIAAATDYTPGEASTIYTQVLNGDGSPANNATVTLTLWSSNGTKELDGVSMTYIVGSQGTYKLDFITPSVEGTYVAEVVSSNPTGYGSTEIHIVDYASEGSNITASDIWGEHTTDYTSGTTFGGLLNTILGGNNMGIGIVEIIFVIALCVFALWKKDWLRVVPSIGIVIWGAFAMPYDIKIAAPLTAIGTILFIMGILTLIKKFRGGE